MKPATQKLLLWLAIPVALLALVFALRAGILAICLYAFALILGIARLMPYLWLRPVTVEREVSPEVVEIGERVRVIVKVKNNSWLPILWLYAEETLPEKMARTGTWRRLLFLPPGRSFHMLYTVTPSRRGLVQLGPMVLESGDVFGLFRQFRVDPWRDFVTVLPSYRVIEEFQVGRQRRLGDMRVTRSLFEDPSRVQGIREYRRGDALKAIHWKTSARTGELRTKIFEPIMEAGATIFLDFHKETWRERNLTFQADRKQPPFEVAIEICCSVARYLGDGGWKVGFFSNGRDPLGLPGITVGEARATDTLRAAFEAARTARADDRLVPISIRARRSREQFHAIRENLGRLQLTDGLQIESLMFDELAHVERSQALVFLTGDARDDLIAAIGRARQLGFRIMLFMVCNDEAHDLAFKALVPQGVEVFRMDLEWRLKEIATGRQLF